VINSHSIVEKPIVTSSLSAMEALHGRQLSQKRVAFSLNIHHYDESTMKRHDYQPQFFMP